MKGQITELFAYMAVVRKISKLTPIANYTQTQVCLFLNPKETTQKNKDLGLK